MYEREFELRIWGQWSANFQNSKIHVVFISFQCDSWAVRIKNKMATQRVLPQSKETLLQNYNKRLKDDIRSILDNFTEIIKTAKVGLCETWQFNNILGSCGSGVNALGSWSEGCGV